MNIDNLKHAREAVHLTQSQAAKKLGISDGTYKNYEQGKREPNNSLLCEIASLFNVSTDYLLGRESDELDPLDALVGQFNMTALEKKIVEGYLELPEDMRDDLMDFLNRAVKEVEEESK